MFTPGIYTVMFEFDHGGTGSPDLAPLYRDASTAGPSNVVWNVEIGR